MPKRKEREYRDFDASGLELRAQDDGQMWVEGYATTFDDEYLLVDALDYKVYESIDRHALDEADMTDVIMQYDHEGHVFARGTNNTLYLSTDDKGLAMRGRLDGTEIGRRLFEEIKGGYTTRMSWVFRAAKDERTEEWDAENRILTLHRKITKVKKVYDVSAVSLPANPDTAIYARGELGDGEIEKLRAERLARMAREQDKLRLKILMGV